MLLSTSMIICEICNATQHINDHLLGVLCGDYLNWRYTDTYLLYRRSLFILENLSRGLLVILKTPLSPKDQRILCLPFFTFHKN